MSQQSDTRIYRGHYIVRWGTKYHVFLDGGLKLTVPTMSEAKFEIDMLIQQNKRLAWQLTEQITEGGAIACTSTED